MAKRNQRPTLRKKRRSRLNLKTLPKLDSGPVKSEGTKKSPSRARNARTREKSVGEKLTALAASAPTGDGPIARAISAGLSGAALGATIAEAFSKGKRAGSASRSKSSKGSLPSSRKSRPRNLSQAALKKKGGATNLEAKRTGKIKHV